MSRVTRETTDRVALIRIDNPPVNALAHGVLAGLQERLEDCDRDPEVAAIVIVGANHTFIAGADISRLERIAAGEPLPSGGPVLGDLLDRIERSDKPVVAAIDGFALGGGLELALACAARVGTPGARLGLPELSLGLIPGAGGTQRLPRLVGVPRAVSMMLGGKHLGGEDAAEAGLLDELADAAALEERARAQALAIAEGRQPRRRTLELPLEHVEGARRAVAEARAGLRTRNVGYPDACLDAVLFGIEHGPEQGLLRERELFRELLGSDAARGLIHVFFAERRASKVPGVTDAELSPRAIRRVGVVGGGTMGSGIATALCSAGMHVTLVEVDAEREAAARERVSKNIEKNVARGRISAEQARSQLEKLTTAGRLEALADAELVIEAATEDAALKRDLFAKLEKLTSRETVLASNTSTIDIGELAQATGSPARVLGLHFFSPAHVMKLVEVVRAPQTSTQALVDALGLVKKLKKTPVCVQTCPGFLVNRVFAPYSRITGFLIDRGVDPYRIDRALYDFGMPMGPCRMSDLAGIDVGIAAGGILDQAHADRSYRSALRALLADAGRLGEKSGRGHYRYDSGKAAEDPALTGLVHKARELAGNPEPIDPSDEEIVHMALFGVVNEACRALDEGVALRAGDVDVAAILGMGFPAYRGGPMKWADGIGARRVLESVSAWHARFGLGLFAPSEGLSARAERGSFSF